jgi:hypothetical protein
MRQQQNSPIRPKGIGRAAREWIDVRLGIWHLHRWWQLAVGVVVVVGGQAELLEVVGALDAGGGLADLLDGGQQQADQDGDDGDDDEQFDEGEARKPALNSRPANDYLKSHHSWLCIQYRV